LGVELTKNATAADYQKIRFIVHQIAAFICHKPIAFAKLFWLLCRNCHL